MRKHHKEETSVWKSSFRNNSVRERNPKENSVRGSIIEGKLPFPLISNGERFIRCMVRESNNWIERVEE
jgi:hypothetical protein